MTNAGLYGDRGGYAAEATPRGGTRPVCLVRMREGCTTRDLTVRIARYKRTTCTIYLQRCYPSCAYYR
jgi:hypothetical protein